MSKAGGSARSAGAAARNTNTAARNTGDPFAPPEPVRRREARERAIELLYESEMKQCEVEQVVSSLSVELDPRTLALVEGISADLVGIDQRLGELLANGWSVDRLASCDRWILRQGIFELTQAVEPIAVVISEAVALAQSYGATHRSAALVNGILASAAGVNENI